MSAVAEEKKIIKGGAFLIEERAPEDIFTPEDFTEEHRMIADTTRQFIDNEVNTRIDELEKHDWNVKATAAALGIPLSTLKFKMDRLDIRGLARKVRTLTRSFKGD